MILRMPIQGSTRRVRRFGCDRAASGGRRGFTMIEIAIALAVIGFALVAIIGILPMGLNIQKETRERTIINHDAMYFLDALKNSAQGLDELTNFVARIDVDGAILYNYKNRTPPDYVNGY